MSQKIDNVKFIKGILGSDVILRDGKTQVAFLGRSNVGKSSVINSLVNRKALVKSSATPGKTREINFFLINNSVYFVDLPGYGYAKISHTLREKLRKMILWYVTASGVEKRKFVLIVDAKVGLSEFDKQMISLFYKNNFEFLIVANKIDRLNQGERKKQLCLISDNTHVNVLPHSAKTKEGRDELLKEIFS